MNTRYLSSTTKTFTLSDIYRVLVVMAFLMMGSQSLIAQLPQVTIESPNSALLGESFTFELSLDNADSALIGYDPIVELILPALPDDGPGNAFPDNPTLALSFQGATYLGNSVYAQFVGYFDEETGSLVNPLTGQEVYGEPRAGLYLLHYPLSSIAPDQPAPIIEVEAKMNSLTPIGLHPIAAKGIFNYGNDPSGQSPAIVGAKSSSSVTPTLLKVRKTVSYAETETATGPSFPGTWSLIGNVAKAATLENVLFTDSLPDNFHVLTATIIRPAGGQLSLTGSNPGRSLSASWLSVSGSTVNASSEILIEITGYVPEKAQGASLVLAPSTGEGEVINAFDASYDFERVGVEAEGGINVSVTSNQVNLDALTLAIQKSASVVADSLPAGLSPQDTVEFALSLQVSDFKQLDSVRIEDGIATAAGLDSEADILGDGLTFQSSFTPTYQVSIGGVSVSGSFSPSNYTVMSNPVGHELGSSRIVFDLSQQLIDDGQFDSDGVLTGAALQKPVSVTGTTAQIRYRATIDTDFDSPDSGDASIDILDVLQNDVDVVANDLTDSIVVGDESAATLKMQSASVFHAIERIITVEGEVIDSPSGTPLVSPGDTVTFSIRCLVPTGDVENFVLEDYIPYSLFDVNNVNGDGVSGDTPSFSPVVEAYPAVGQVRYGPSDEYAANYSANGAPSFAYSIRNNSLSLDYGDFDTPTNIDSNGDLVYEFEIRFTLVAGMDDLADGFEMTSLARLTHSSTNGGDADIRTYTGLLFSKSVPVITKGVVSCDSVDAIISPAATGYYDHAGSSGTCVGARAGDLVRFAITLQNTGSDPMSYLQLRDVLPASFDASAARIVSVNRADGIAMVMSPAVDGVAGTADEAALFGSGIALDASVVDNYLEAGSAEGAPYGAETLIVLLDVPVVTDVAPNELAVNFAYADAWHAQGVPVDGSFVQVSESTSVITETLSVEKALVYNLAGDDSATVIVDDNGTDVATGTIGEVMTYDITLNVPQGEATNVVVSDTLPAGLAIATISGVKARVVSIDSSISSSQLSAGDTDVSSGFISAAGGAFTFNFGTLTRPVSADIALKPIVVRVYTYVDDVVGNAAGISLSNSVTVNWDGGSATDLDDFTVVRPNVVLDKTMTPVVSGELQAGSTVRVDLTVSNNGTELETSAAHDFVIEDVVLSEYFDTTTIVEGSTPEGFVFSTEPHTDGIKVVYSSVDVDRGESFSFNFTVNLKDDLSLPVTIQNTATATGTSLPSTPVSGVESTESDDDLEETASNYPTVTKSVISSSESHTTDSPLVATIGERLVYRLRVDVPEGQLPSLTVTDQVPSGMDFVGTNSDPLMAFPGVGYSISGPMSTQMSGLLVGVTDTDPTPNSSLTNDGNGRDVVFTFGAVENFPDGDSANDYFYIDLELVVLDRSNVVGHGNSPSRLTNRGLPYVPGMTSNQGRSNAVHAEIAEPLLAIDKSILESSGDGGDAFTVQITLTNNGHSDAFDMVVEDPIPGAKFKTAQIDLDVLTPIGWSVALDSVPADDDTDTTVVMSSDLGTGLAPGESVVFQFSVFADDTIEAPSIIVNTAEITQVTTLDGSLAHPAGITERDSSGATDSANINISNATLQLTYISSSESSTSDDGVLPVLTFGERALFRIDVDLPDGTLMNGMLHLLLPNGLDFVGTNSDALLAYPSAGFGGFAGDFGSFASSALVGVIDVDATPSSSESADGSGSDIVFQFNPIVNLPELPNDDPNDDNFYFFVELVCVDDTGLVGYGDNPDQLTASLRMDGGDGYVGQVTSPITVELAEPVMGIEKTMSVIDAANPDQTTVTVVLSNSGLSPAYDIRVEDVLDPAMFDVGSTQLVSVPENYIFANESGTVVIESDGASVPVGGNATFVFNVDVLPSANSPVTNVAQLVNSSTLDHSEQQPAGIGERLGPVIEDEAALLIPEIVALKKVTDLNYTGAPLEPLDQIAYTITVQNAGGATASQVKLLDSIPTNTTYVANSLRVDDVQLTPSSPDMVIDLGSIAAGESKVVYFEVEVNASLPVDARKIVNTASATYAERSTVEVADNDPDGHDPTVDDGIDDPADSGSGTADDDPTELYLLQGATTMRSYLAFEDLKNRGWSDWDHNDVLLDITTHYMLDDSDNVEAVIVLYQFLARGGAYEGQIKLTIPYDGYGEWKSSYMEDDGTFISSTFGSAYSEMTAEVYASIREAMPPHPDVLERYSWGPSRTVPYDPTLPGRRAVVHLELDSTSLNPFSGFSVSPHDTWLHLTSIYPIEEIHRVQYEIGNTQIALEGPLAGRSLPLVVEFPEGFDWPAEFKGIYDSHPQYVDYIKSGGTSNADWWRYFDPNLVWVDANGNTPGVGEPLPLFAQSKSMSSFVFLQSNSGSQWPLSLGNTVSSSPVLRDLDGDGLMEVLIGRTDFVNKVGKVYIFDHEGNVWDGWPQETKAISGGENIWIFGLFTSPSVGDIDNDGNLDIVVGSLAGHLYAWDLDGTVKSGFPAYLGRPIKSVCAVVDIDGIPGAEIIVHNGDSELHVVDGRGNALSGWPVDLGGELDNIYGAWSIGSSPMVFDMHLDGSLQIAVGSTANKVHIFNADGTPVSGWPQTTGDWVYSSIIPVDLDGDYEPEIVAGSGDHNLYAWKADGTLMSGFPVTLDAALIGTVAAADITGDGANELIATTLEGTVYVVDATGAGVSGWPQQANGGIHGSAIIIDADGDNELDVVVGSRDNWLYAWKADGTKIESLSVKSADWIESTPAATDIDGDGLIELVYASFDGVVNVIELTSAATDANLVWPAFRGDRALSADAVVTDLDGDLLPDALELALFGGYDVSGRDDQDGDGFDNVSEWIAGTSLEDGSDYFSVGSGIVNTDSGMQFQLTWTGRAGRSYKVYCSATLGSEDDWELVELDAIQYTDGLVDMSWQAEVLPGVPSQFFRVVVERGNLVE